MGNVLLKRKIVIGIILLFFTSSFVSAFDIKQQFPSDGVQNIFSNGGRMDQPLILPDWNDGEYHDYDTIREKLLEFNDNFQDLVCIFSIGKTVLNKDIWCIRITNENNTSHKFSCLYDGCIHGNEWEGGEACLYFAEYLLINFERNNSIREILNKSMVYIVPLVNPDGRQNDDRFNQNGIDLNRNFDVHFGRLLGYSMPLGKLLGFIKIKYIWIPGRYMITNCGRYPFSEPESQALRDVMKQLRYQDFSFYLTVHTAQHDFRCLSDKIIRSEYELSSRELAIFNYTKFWVENHSEYDAQEDRINYGFGSSSSYCFKECHTASFCLEALNQDYEPLFWHGLHDHLVHWMNTTLPVFLYLLVNIENFHNWDFPDIEPLLPQGVPPPPLNNSYSNFINMYKITN